MTRIEYEKQIVEKMIRLYCLHKEGNNELCTDCLQLLSYAHRRLDHCKFQEGKPSCRKCPIHCYNPHMKQRIREIMRWSGPRMTLYHPIDAIKHMWQELH